MKILKILSLLFCLSAFQQVMAQSLPKIYEIKSDTIATITLPDSCWQLLEDNSLKFTIDSFRQADFSNLFKVINRKEQSDGHIVHNSWVRCRLKNTMDREAKIALRFIYGSQCDMYVADNNSLFKHYVDGGFVPLSSRDGIFVNRFSANFLPISILPNHELTIFIKTFSRNGTNLPNLQFRLYSQKQAYETLFHESQNNYFVILSDSFLFGLLLLAFIFNILFYWLIREKIYLYFSLYVLALGLGRVSEEIFRLFLSENPTSHVFFFNFIFVFITFFFTQFLRSLLQISLKHSFLDKILAFLSYFGILLYAIRLTVYVFFPLHYHPNMPAIPVINSVLLWLLLLITLFWYTRKPESPLKEGIYFFLTPFAIWVLCYSWNQISLTLQAFFDIPLSASANWIQNQWIIIEVVCLAWMVIYFSWFLLNKFSELKKQIVQKELEKEIERSQLIEEQNIKLEEKVTQRTDELKKSLDNLKATQNQLIQKEKLASLGELTAGIAHEIQNPLNFVNNFSELSVDLTKELKEEAEKSPLTPDGGIIIKDKEYFDELINDLSSNQEKINHHGKRASSIVSGMLEHSRTSTGERVMTDINKLADEYLRLSYHGMRAKYKNFNSDYELIADENLPLINVVPQDIGRVLLNLINNAFYAAYQSNKPNPKVMVSSDSIPQRDGIALVIRVQDNGNGIPADILPKIFQPFFTTKPTGEGTGLGLSLAYDIVTKGHGGTIEVDSVEGEGTTFVVRLPIS